MGFGIWISIFPARRSVRRESTIVNNKYSILIVNRVKVSINTVYDILSIYGEGVMDLRLKIVKAKGKKTKDIGRGLTQINTEVKGERQKNKGHWTRINPRTNSAEGE